MVNCYTNCVDGNFEHNEEICDEKFSGLIDDRPKQNSMVEKNAFDQEVDPLLGVFPDYWVTMRSQCSDLSDEEYQMFNYKEYSWGHYGPRSTKPGKMIIRHFDNLGIYFFSERFSFKTDNDAFFTYKSVMLIPFKLQLKFQSQTRVSMLAFWNAQRSLAVAVVFSYLHGKMQENTT